MIAVRGHKSAIVQALLPLLPATEAVIEVARGECMPLGADRYLFCAGLLLGKSNHAMEELNATFEANYWSVRNEVDRIVAKNDRARICVIGSESGFAGSYDQAYALAKAGVHQYVEEKKLRTPEQQLVCVAPSIISDAGMTMRRTDSDVLVRKCRAHPKRRFVTSVEVARLVHFVLYVDRGYLSNTVIRMNGGQHTCTS